MKKEKEILFFGEAEAEADSGQRTADRWSFFILLKSRILEIRSY
jgi:hypothetical protein